MGKETKMSEIKRDSFVFYRSFYEAMEDLSSEEQLTIYRAITVFALEGVEPNISGYPKAIFKLMRPILDANNKRWENGKKGGAPKGSSNNPNGRKGKKEPKTNQELTKNKANKDKDVDKDLNNGEFINSPDDVFNELSFENVWNLYEKKGNKKTSLSRWDKLPKKSKELAFANIPLYLKNNQDIKFRKNFETYLNQEVWNDELTTNNPANEESKYKYYE